MKRKIALIIIFSLLLSTISFAGGLITSTPQYLSRTGNQINFVLDYSSTADGTLYYGIAHTSQTFTSSAELVSVVSDPSSYPDFVATGSKSVVSGSPIDVVIDSQDISINEAYYVYGTYVASGVPENMYEGYLPVFTYITGVTYDNGNAMDNTDDRLIIDLSKDYTANSNLFASLRLGVDQNLETGAVAYLSKDSDFVVTQVDSDTISFDFLSTGLEKFNTESYWSVTTSRACDIILSDYYSSPAPFEMDGAKFEFTFDLNQLTQTPPPKLQNLTYLNNKDFVNDKFILTFDTQYSETLTEQNILITFDDKNTSSYTENNYALSSGDFYIDRASSGATTMYIGLNSSAENILKLLEHDTIAKVTITGDSQLIDPAYSSYTVNMPGQNPKLKTITISGAAISAFDPNETSYYKTISYNEFSAISSSPLSFITYETIDPGALVTVTGGASYEMLYYTLDVTSADELQNNTYSIDLFRADNILTDIMVNEVSLSGFSPDKLTYNISVDQNYTVPVIWYTAHSPYATVHTSYTGSLPGTYSYVISVTDNQITNTYELIFTTYYPTSNTDDKDEKEDPPTQDNGTGTTTTTVDNTTAQTPEEEVIENVNTTTSALEQLANSTTSNQEAITTTLDKLEESINKTEDDKTITTTAKALTDLTQNLSITVVSSQGTDTKVNDTINKVSEYVEKLIVKIDDPKTKVEQLDNFTKSVKTIKDSGLDNKSLNKVVDDIAKNTSKSLSKVVVETKKTVGPLPKYVIESAQVDTSVKSVEETAAQLNKTVSEYFGEDNYIKLKKEVQIELTVPKEEKTVQVVIDKGTIDSIKNNNVEKLNIKIDASELSLDSETLSDGSDYEFILQKKDTGEKNDRIAPEVTETLTNNSNYVEVDLFKDGERVENMKKPATLTFDVDYFGYDNETNGDDLAIYRFDDETKAWEPVGGVFDPQTGTITVRRIHLSKYTVMKTKKTITGVDNTEVKSEVQALLNKGVIKGDTSNMKANITREEFVAWLGQSYGLTSTSSATPFEDLDKGSESYKFIASVYEQGIISGKSATTFGAKEFMTYEEVAVILSNTLTKLDNKQINNNLTAKLDKLGADIDISDWAKDEVALVIELGYMDKSVALNSKGYLTREEAAVIFSKFYS